jgi:hypothetical protein
MRLGGTRRRAASTARQEAHRSNAVYLPTLRSSENDRFCAAVYRKIEPDIANGTAHSGRAAGRFNHPATFAYRQHRCRASNGEK